MLSRQEVEVVDKSGLYRDYGRWPSHSRAAFEMEVKAPRAEGSERLVVVGMGGSGVVGDILHDWLSYQKQLEVTVVKDYHLHCSVDHSTFVLAVSASGNTEETISALMEAAEAGACVASISAGGLMEQLSIKRKIPHTRIPLLLTPRSTLPYLFFTSCRILAKTGLIENVQEVGERSIEALESTWEAIKPDVSPESNRAKQIALSIYNFLPAAYGSRLTSSVATRFRASLNENAKMHCISCLIPELCHNEAVAWAGRMKDLRPIFLRSSEEPPEVRQRFKAAIEVIQEAGHSAYEVRGTGQSLLPQILSSIYILDLVSVYAAVLRKADPTPTPGIDRLKEKLAQRLDFLSRFRTSDSSRT